MLNLYTETAFQVTPATTASPVCIQIPRKNGSYDKSKFSSTRATDSRPPPKDQPTFNASILATQSSIYFRQFKTYPRTFYWRVVNNEKSLEVQCADVARAEGDLKEAYFTLRFDFQDQIIPRGVSFADLDTGEEIHAFICTNRNEIFDLRLSTNAFRDPRILNNDNVSQWCSPVESSGLTIDSVHHLHACNPLLVFISFDNYDDRAWGASIRGMVSRRGLQTIEYGTLSLDPRTAQAMATSPDGVFLFTVCMNHTLRVWNLRSGKVIATKDLLDAPRDPNDRTHLNPAEDALLHIFQPQKQKFPTILTYTPHDGGQFKFWDMKGGLTDSVSVEDKYPGVRLSSPDPDPSGNTVWSMVGFKLDPGKEEPAQLWVLWRNHHYHQLYNCQFEFGSIASSWKSNWVKCNATSSSKNPAPEFVRADEEDPTSKWLDFFFFPGRYSDAGLETALSIFEEATSVKLTSTQKASSLKQRMCAIVGVGVSLRKYGDSEPDYDRFSIDTDSQWRNLFRIAENVNDSRNAPLSLAYDSFSHMVWIPMADRCCAVRECSKLELLQQNELGDIQDLEDATARVWTHRKVSTEDGESFRDLALLISAARTFRESFSPDLAKHLTVAIEEDLSIGAEYVTPTRIYEIYDSIGFSEAVSNDVFERLESELTPVGGLSALNNELFLGILELSAVRSKRAKSALRNTLFGNLLLSAGMLNFLLSQQQLLMDLLALAVFVEGELNQEEVKMTAFDASELFDHIGPLLRLCNRSLWLASNHRSVPLEVLGSDGHPNAHRRSSTPVTEGQRLVTIFEDTLSKAVRPHPAIDKPLMYLITDQLSEIDDWASGKDAVDPDDGAVYLQCDLLKQGQLDLATDFLKFQPSTPWSSYVKGRLAVAKSAYDVAALYFRRASFALACGKAVGSLVDLSAGLLSMIEAECFNNGLPLYLHHITTLFESAKAYNEASQFANLTLEAMQAGQNEPLPSFRTEVLSRLFNAELKLLRFDRAYDALVQLPDQALQRSSVIALVNGILNSHSSISGAPGAVQTLKSLPWAMYPHLAHLMNQHIISLAKGQTSADAKSSASAWLASDAEPDYLSILHSIRVSQKDYRGTVTVLYDRLKMIRRSGRARHDPQSTALRHILLALINAMACVAPEEAYIIAEADDTAGVSSSQANGESRKKRCRVVITLEDLRKEYQAVLDKCSRIERGDFDFELDGEESDDDEADVVPDQSRLNMSSHTGHGDAMEF